MDCSGFFTEDALNLISDVLNWVRIIVPILLVVLIAVDFGGAVLQQDNDIIKKATGKVVKRAIAAAAVFFIPTIVRFVINLPGVRDTIQIPSDPLCGTMNSNVVESELLIK